MKVLRILMQRNYRFAFALLVLAFIVKAAIPAGYMVAPSSDKLVQVMVCHGGTGERTLAQIAIPMKPETEQSPSHGESKQKDCAFSGLTQAALAGASPVLLAIALAAILLLGLAPLGRILASPIPHLRPPLRGPPAAI